MWDDAIRTWPSSLDMDINLSYPLTLEVSPTSSNSDGDARPSFRLPEAEAHAPNGLGVPGTHEHVEGETRSRDEGTTQETTALVNGYSACPEPSEDDTVDDIELDLEYSLNLVQDIDLDGALSGSLVVNLSR